MRKPIDLIDSTAQQIGRSLDIVVYAIDGLFEKYARENPTPQGLAQFYRAAGDIMTTALQGLMVKLTDGQHALEQTLSASERAIFDSQDDAAIRFGDAQDTFWGAFQQVRAQYVKRLREIIVARAFGLDTYNANPHVMTRNGRRWNFADYTYLTTRRILIDRYNEAKIAYIASLGAQYFTMDTEDPDLANKAFKVSDYPDIAEEYFHPRTQNLVGEAHVSP